MTYLMSILLGFVQGVAEFLPISSSGHLSILQNLLGVVPEGEHMFFNVLLHLGSLISVIVVFRRELGVIFFDLVGLVSGTASAGEEAQGRFTPGVRIAFLIAAATLPMVMLLPFYGQVETLMGKPGFIAFELIATGVILFAADRLPAGRKTGKTSTVVDAVIVGLAQVVAAIPGISRSGVTIAVGLSRGFKRDFAVRFSFLLSVPAVFGAFLVSFYKAIKAGIDWSLFPIYLVGMVVSALTGIAAIYLVRYIVNRGKFGNFAYYCWFVGLITLILTWVL